MSKNVLFFHIGTPKTGTTALRRFLCNNRDLLKQYGWCYPDLSQSGPYGGDSRNGMPLLRAMWDGNADLEVLWQKIKEYLKCYSVILSAEAFYSDLNSFIEILRQAERYHIPAKIIVYFRRQDFFAESRWNQRIKDVFLTDAINNCPKLRAQGDYYECLERLEEVIGIDNINVRIYEKGQLAGDRHDTVSDFCSFLGIFPDWGESPVGRENVRLRGNMLEIRRLFNSIYNNAEEATSFRRAYAKLFYAVNQENDHRDEGYLSLQERKSIMKECQEGNACIAKKYLGRADGRLFYEEVTDIPQYKATETEFEKDMVRFFSNWLLELDSKVELLLFDRFAGIVESLANNRKKAFFGAGFNCSKILAQRRIHNIEVILDNSFDKSGDFLEGIPVRHISEIEHIHEYFIVITVSASETIEKQLMSLGLKKNINFLSLQDFLLL